MSRPKCDACESLREDAPNLIVNGLGDTECTSLANNTGLNPSSGNDDCEDLHNLNDCLVGGLEPEIDAYDVCEWKEFTRNFVNNTWTTMKGVICAVCGLWENVKSILARLTKLECQVNSTNDGITFQIGEDTSGDAYVAAGKGVSFLKRVGETSQYSAEVGLVYIAGGLAQLRGSLVFHTTNFTDPEACVNFDNGSAERKTASRLGNTEWAQTGNTVSPGNELVFEVRVKRSAYPQVKRFFDGFGQEVDAAGFHVMTWTFNEGEYAFGQHGECDKNTGQPTESGLDSGHLVPSGWTYIQVRMSQIMELVTSGNNTRSASIRMFMGMRVNLNEVDC